MINLLSQWLESRPTEEEIAEGMEELAIVIAASRYPASYNQVKRVLQWAMMSHYLPTDFWLVKVQEELNGKK